MKTRFKLPRLSALFALSGILAIVGLVSCDIGNWDITMADASRRNFAAFEEIDFLTGEILSGPRAGEFIPGRTIRDEDGGIVMDVSGEPLVVGRAAYPLIFGTSSNNRGSGIFGGGQRSMRFQNEAFARSVAEAAARNVNHLNFGIPMPWRPGVAGYDDRPWVDLPLPQASPHRLGDTARHFPGGVVPDYVPPGFIEISATRSGQGGGKIAGSEDGIAFLFREVPHGRLFRMTADFLIISYGNLGPGRDSLPHNPGSNGQEGFGIMVRDFVPQISEGLPGRMGGSGGGGVGGPATGTTMRAWEENHRWRFESDEGGNLLAGMTHEGAVGDSSIGMAGAGSHPENASFHHWVGSSGFGADSNMIMAGGTKRGMRVKWRAGITAGAGTMGECGNPTLQGIQNPGRFRFEYFPRMLGDYSLFTDCFTHENCTNPHCGGERVPTMAARPDFPRWGSTVRVTLEKTNAGFRYHIRTLDDYFDNFDTDTGQLLTPARRLKPPVNSDDWGVIPHHDILNMVNNRHYYVGFFASRDAVVWVHNITYEEANAEDTPRAPDFVPEIWEPEFEVVSPPFYGGTRYLYVTANTRGRITVTQDGRVIPERLIINEWIVETQNGMARPRSLFTVPIWAANEGDNIFSITFHPDSNTPGEIAGQGFIHGSVAPQRQTFNMVRRTFQDGTRNIYVAPVTGRPAVGLAPAIPSGVRTDGGALGGPAGDGSRDRPLDLRTAVNHVMPGQHIVMLNGWYVMGDKFVIPRFNDGRQDAMKVLRAESVNGVWLDWNKNEFLSGSDGVGGEAFLMLGSFWHFDGFHIRGAPDRAKGIVVGGSNNLITRLMVYNNGCTGFQISGSQFDPVRFWPRDNVVKWTESFHNLDTAQTNADGFGTKLTVGPRNRFYSAIAHHNNDDAWDLFTKRDTGPIGVVVIEYSIAYRQGTMLNNFATIAGHNGFKMGGEGVGGFHEIRQSLSFANGEAIGRGWQITSNSNPNLMVFDTTTVNHNPLDHVPGDSGTPPLGGNIEVRPGGTGGVAAGNVFRTVAANVYRRGGTAHSTTGSFAPNATFDWRAVTVGFGPDFWGRHGDAIGAANAMIASGSGATAPMPACYSGWIKFEYFFPRDDLFAYPIIGDNLFRPPVGYGAHGFYDRDAVRDRAFVLSVIPWAAGQEIFR